MNSTYITVTRLTPAVHTDDRRLTTLIESILQVLPLAIYPKTGQMNIHQAMERTVLSLYLHQWVSILTQSVKKFVFTS
jgi:hypothetical protein